MGDNAVKKTANRVAGTINDTGKKIQDTAKKATEAVSKHVGNVGNYFKNDLFAENPGILAQVIQGFLAVLILFIIIEVCKLAYKKYVAMSNSNPFILPKNSDGGYTYSADRQHIIHQDPKAQNAGDESIKTLQRSKDQNSGIEFTYLFWINVSKWDEKVMGWKHVFHKGTQEGEPLRCPAVWLHPVRNSMRIYMNTMKSPNEYLDVDDIPIQKWICIGIAVKQNKLDVYINGNIIKSKTFSSPVKQNYGDVYVTNQGGFDGYISRLRYFNNYITYSQLRDFLIAGPDPVPLDEADTMPPYFDSRYWSRSK